MIDWKRSDGARSGCLVEASSTGTAWTKAMVIGGLSTVVVFMVLPLSQMFSDPDRQIQEVREVNVVEPPPEPPVTEEQPKRKKTDQAKPQLRQEQQRMPTAPKLEQVDLALNASAASALRGDFEFGFPDVESGLKAFKLAEVDQNPQPIAKVDPQYPTRLKWDGVSGAVQLRIVVDQNGNVIDVNVERSTHQAFSRACVRAIRQWRFKPGRRNGKAVATQLLVPFRFEPPD